MTEIVTGSTIGIGLETIIDVTIGETTTTLMKDEAVTGKITETDKVIEEMTPTKGTGIGVRVETDQETIVVTILEVEIETEMDKYNKE